jgi:hypothetical protein
MKYCSSCGASVLEKSRFCSACGTPVLGPIGGSTSEQPDAVQEVSDQEKIRYDISGLEPAERKLILESLVSGEIVHSVDGLVLTVDRKSEADVDAIIEVWEQWGEEARRSASLQKRVSSGDLSARVCELCGNMPAASITLRRQVGMVIMRTHYQSDLVLCDPCGQAVTKEFQKQTALKGWTGVYSAMTNPFVIAANSKNRRRHKNELKERGNSVTP